MEGHAAYRWLTTAFSLTGESIRLVLAVFDLAPAIATRSPSTASDGTVRPRRPSPFPDSEG
jgi:hypothetical protein